jgi:uncharacterized protein (TIGR02246 family)
MRTVLFAVSLLVIPGLVHAQAKGNPKDEAAIKATVAAFDAAVNKGDAKAVAAIVTDDAVLVSPMGERMTGKAEIEQKMGANLAGPFKGATQTITPTSIRFVKPDVAIGDADIEVTGMKSPDGKSLPPVKHKGSAVFTKQKGKWVFASAWAYVFLPPPGGAAPK